VSQETFEIAQERLEQNRRLSARRTIEPTLLQGMLVCGECGYAFYRCSTRTSRRKIHYYRCLGSDAYRHLNGPLCHNRPVRQDYLDRIVWQRVIQLLEDPDLVRSEIQRRIKEIQDSNPTKHRKEALSKEITRVQEAIEKLLDAYQEGLVKLEELRKRLPELRRRQEGLNSELYGLEAACADQQAFLCLANTIGSFLERLRATGQTLSVTQRQKVLRLVVKEILVYPKTIKIKHSIPVSRPNTPIESSGTSQMPSYLLRSGSHHSPLWGPFVRVCQDAFFQHPSIEPLADQPHYAPIVDPLLNKRSEQPMVQVVEASTDICVHYPADIHTPTLVAKFPQGLMGTAPRSEAVGEIMELLLVDRSQQHDHRPLDDLVLKGRFADRTPSSILLLKPCPLHRRCFVPPPSQTLMKTLEVLLKVLGILPGRHPIYPCRTILPRQTIGFPQKLHIHQMHQRREYHLRIANGLLRNLLEFR
jgi:site-specific DNA recombinase